MRRTFLALGAIALTVGTVAVANNKVEKRAVPSSLYVKLSPTTCQLVQSSGVISLWQDNASAGTQAQIQSSTGTDYPVFANSNCDNAGGTINRVKFN